jgi:hypothetical protein
MQPLRRSRNPVDREACPGHKTLIGAWRSLVAHLPGGQGVAGSNPVAPTTKILYDPETWLSRWNFDTGPVEHPSRLRWLQITDHLK